MANVRSFSEMILSLGMEQNMQSSILLFTVLNYSTVTDFAKFLGWSTSVPLCTAT